MARKYSTHMAYIVGIALGDGNLSNPNKRAYRLRITCDKKYPFLIEYIIKSLKKEFPINKISKINRNNCVDISLYSNKLPEIFGWYPEKGSKIKQNIGIPKEILSNQKLLKYCLKGLFETDGSIYFDRKYKMVNFVTKMPKLAKDVFESLKKIHPEAKIYKINENNKPRWNIRISKNVDQFISKININKS